MISGIPRRPVGSTPAAAFFQWVYDSLTGPAQVRGGRGVRVSRTTRGTIIEAEAVRGGGGGTVSQYVITEFDSGDYFVARTIDADGTCGTEDIIIAKPYHLRRTPFDAVTPEPTEEEPDPVPREQDVTVETWDGTDLTTEVRTYSYEYKSATLRIKTDITTPESPVNETQAVIPRFVPAVLIDDPESQGGVPPLIVENECPTIIYAINCSGMDVLGPADESITLLALNDGWAWAKLQ